MLFTLKHKLFNSITPSVHKMITHTVKFLQHLLQGFWSVLDHCFIVTIGSLRGEILEKEENFYIKKGNL